MQCKYYLNQFIIIYLDEKNNGFNFNRDRQNK
jgi:hypothetical protein